jgi:hypothetical protein
MKPTFVAETGSHGRGTSSRCAAALPLALAVLLCAAVVLFSPPAAEAQAAPCTGPWVQSLAGPHAVTRVPIDDVADLRRRLPELEAGIRAVVTGDPTLGPVVADGLIAAIRDGAGITERPMQADEAVRWMAYQPRPGQIETISPACLRLKRSYDAFAITVEIPEPSPRAATPTCAVSAVRDCAAANPAITVDLRGSSPGARVSMAAGARPEVPLSGAGERLTVADPGPYDLEATFTVRVEGPAAPARTARVFRFLMPKICGNLVYLGEAASRTLAPAGAPATCEQSVRVGRCAAAPEPPPSVEPAPEADLCEAGWVVRPFLFGFFPTGDDQERDIVLPFTGPARESFELEQGYGLGVAVERRLGPVFGLEAAVMVGKGDSEYEIDNGAATESDSHSTTFYAFTLGPNFHLLGCGGTDLYLGPFVGYGGFADPNYWAFDHHFGASFDGDFVWGAQLGLDAPFGDGPWGFHGGLRYIELSQDTDAGTLRVDPLLVTIGLSYRF